MVGVAAAAMPLRAKKHARLSEADLLGALLRVLSLQAVLVDCHADFIGSQ